MFYTSIGIFATLCLNVLLFKYLEASMRVEIQELQSAKKMAQRLGFADDISLSQVMEILSQERMIQEFSEKSSSF